MCKAEIRNYIESLYSDTSSSSVSSDARKEKNLYGESTFVYGDTDLNSLDDMISYMQPKGGDVFYDLGAGGGRVVFYAALSFAFAKCAGIEMLEALTDFAKARLEKFKNNLHTLPQVKLPSATKIDFINGSVTEVDLQDADLLYTYSTCFDDSLMKTLGEHLDEQLKPGAKVITVTKPLPSSGFKLLKRDSHMMFWGKATTWFYEKI